MTGALVVLVLAFAGAFRGGSNSKTTNKPRSLGLAVISAVVGAIALFIAFPTLLSFGGAMSLIALVAVGLGGLAAILLGFQTQKLPTGIMILVGATLISWALFRYLPTGPAAFQYFGAAVSKAGNDLWNGGMGALKILTGGK